MRRAHPLRVAASSLYVAGEYPNQPITSSSFWSATPLAGAPAPQAAGSRQSMAIGGVSGSAVYFAIRTVDGAGNISALSNVACVGRCRS